MIPNSIYRMRALLLLQAISLLITCMARADWPLRDKDLRGSRWAAGATHAVSLDVYPPRWEIPSADFVLIGDVQGDDKLEVVAQTLTAIKIFDAAGNEIHSIPFTGGDLGCLADVDGDGKKEILVGKRESDNNLSVYVFKGDGTQLKLIPVPHGAYDCGISPWFAADIDNDGQLEVVSGLSTGYSIQRRGLEVSDYLTGKQKWGTDIGPFVRDVRLADIDGNGQKELVHGDGSPANGRVGADGTVDWTGYTFCYAAGSGTRLWLRSYTCCGFDDAMLFLPDLNGDGQVEVVAEPTRHGWDMADYGVGSLQVLNPADGSTTASVDFSHRTDSGLFADLNGDGKEEMVISYHDSTTAYVKSFAGTSLTPLGTYSRDGGWMYCYAACDLNGDGKPEILAVFSNGSGADNDKLLILNADLTQVLREIDLGEHDIRNVIVSDLDGDGSVEILAVLTDKVVVLASVEAPTAKIAIVNPDHFRILKHGWKEDSEPTDLRYYSIANGSVPDDSYAITNIAAWTGLGTSRDYITTVLSNVGYRVDTYSAADFPSVTRNDYQLVIVQDPMTEVGRPFDPIVEYNEPDLLQYVTNTTFLSRLDSYFKGGGGVILVGDAVRLLENGPNRLNYGKQVVAQNATNSVPQSSLLIPSHWLFIRGCPFCCLDRSGSGTYVAQGGALAASGVTLSTVSLFDGNDRPRDKVWSDTVYYPTDAVSLLDVRAQGSGQYVLECSICVPPVYQDSVDFEYPNFMGYTEINGRKVFYIGSDSFFDFQFRYYDGTWHCGQYQEIKNQIGAGGVNAILGLVQAAIPPVTSDSDSDGVPDDIDQCPNTPTGSIVNADGCSIDQLVPCEGPASGGKWKNHGQYVQAVVGAATDFLKAKLITRRQWMEIVTRAAWSKCGWSRRCDHDWDWNWHRNWDCDRDRDWGRGRNWDRD